MTTHHEATTLGLDDPWLAEPPKRSRLRVMLLVLLTAALVFFAGVEVQRRYGGASTAAASPQAGGFTLPDGANAGAGVFPGGGTATASPGADDQGSQSSGSSTVIGTVLSLKGDTLTVEDFGGTTHTITLGSDVRVVLETTGDSDDVKRGSTVQVSGQADDQGQVTATTITVR